MYGICCCHTASEQNLHALSHTPSPFRESQDRLQGGGHTKRLPSPSIRHGGPEGMQSMAMLWFLHLAYWLDPHAAGPGCAVRRVGRQWFALEHGPTLPLRRRVSACSYAGRASHCSSTRLYWCTFYRCPYPKHSCITVLVNTATLWGLGNNLALDPIPWKLALISSGRR